MDHLPERNRLNANFDVPIVGQKQEPENLQISIVIDQGRVVLVFGRAVASVGFDARAARMIACKLIEASDKLPGGENKMS